MAKIISYMGSMDALVWSKTKKGLTSDYEVIVPVSHEAIFFKDGRIATAFIEGRYLLSEDAVGQNKLFASSDEVVDCTVYYIKKEGTYNIKWAVPKPISIVDPKLKVPVEVELSGVFAIKIISAKTFLERLLTFTKKVNLEEVKHFFRERMILHIKDQILSQLRESDLSIVEIGTRLASFSKNLEIRVRYLFESFGVSIEGVELKKADIMGVAALKEAEENK